MTRSLPCLFHNRFYRGFGKCNAFWSIAPSLGFERILKQITHTELSIMLNPSGKAIDQNALHLPVVKITVGRRLKPTESQI